MLAQVGWLSHKDTGLFVVALRQERGGFLMGEKKLAECACPVRWKGRATRVGRIDASQAAATQTIRGDSRYEVQKDESCAGGGLGSFVRESDSSREREGKATGSLVGGGGEKRGRRVEVVGSRKLGLAQMKMGKGVKENRRVEKGRAARKGEGKEGDSRSGRRRRRRVRKA